MAHREWNPKSFFRKLTPEVVALLAERFRVKLEDDGEADSAYRAWKKLQAGQKKHLDAHLSLVNDLCGTHARSYLNELASTVWATTETFEQSRNWSSHDLAVRLSLDALDQFASVHQRFLIEIMDHLTEYRGKRVVAVKASTWAKSAMRNAMAEHFREHAGGARCKVEDFEAPDKFALFIHHEDEVTPTDTFDDQDQIVPIWQRPVVQIAAIFYPEHSTLMVKAPNKMDREKLRDLFASLFIGEADFFQDVSGEPAFDLNVLKRENLDFPTRPADHIQSVSVVKLVLKAPQRDVRRLVFEFTSGLTMEGIAQVLSQRGLQLAELQFDAAHLRVTFDNVKGRARDRTVSLQWPNRSNLRDTPTDRKIRTYLKEWGLDARNSAFRLAPAPSRVA